jgi:hypothetical protein
MATTIIHNLQVFRIHYRMYTVTKSHQILLFSFSYIIGFPSILKRPGGDNSREKIQQLKIKCPG